MSLNRRDLMKLSWMASAAALVGRFPFARADERGPAGRIIVIGAGVAGLAAARALADAGQSVVVLEGQDHVGGRVVTSRKWAGIPCDLGASWIQGISGNPIAALARQWGLETKPTDLESATIFRFDGHRLSEDELDAVESHVTRILKGVESERERVEEAGVELALGPVIERLLRNARLDRMERRVVAQLLRALIVDEYAAELDELSLLHYDALGDSSGADVVFPNGYDEVPRRMARTLDVRLGQVVESIDYTGDDVVVSTTKDTFQCDGVVVTLPLGVLKKGGVEFDPPLPDRKRAAIRRLGMGVLDKVFLRFPRAFWARYDTDVFGFVGENSGAWAETLNVYKVTGKPVLLCFQSGAVARSAEARSDERIVDDAMGWIRAAFGRNVPDPEAAQITRWAADPFALGAYSFIRKGATPDDIEALAAPVDGRVFFAGEATSSENPATVHGAYESGLRAAGELLEAE